MQSEKHLTRTPQESAQNIEDADLEVAKNSKSMEVHSLAAHPSDAVLHQHPFANAGECKASTAEHS